MASSDLLPRKRLTITGRRRLPSATLAAKTSETPSSRLTRVRNEPDVHHVTVLNRLLKTLGDNEVPGPQLFRLQKEFSEPLGEGGQGNVRGINKECAELYRLLNKGDKTISARWPVELIAIKQHQQRKVTQKTQGLTSPSLEVEPEERNLSSRLKAAECEVLALSPSLFRGHPNIVQLVGWGLCLDTIEDPKSTCCGSIHIPLLVLERAEMNLFQFLQYNLFPQETCNPEAKGEEGSAPAPGGIADLPPLSERVWTPRSGWSVLAQRAGIEMNPYKLVRLLCLDIGHGLQSLHEHKFTHGDLKPQNVLLFKSSRRWVAKLCDFGCARGQIDDAVLANGSGQPDQPQKEQYLGTSSWLPPKEEVESYHDYEGLRRCDVYVYGLVVWSSFCLRGDSPPPNPTLGDVKEHLKRFSRGSTGFPGDKGWFERRIYRLLKAAMASPDKRNPTPWVYLESRRECIAHSELLVPAMSATKHLLASVLAGLIFLFTTVLAKLGSLRQARIPKPNVQVPLSSNVKAAYNTKDWWNSKAASDISLTDQGVGLAIAEPLGIVANSPDSSSVLPSLPVGSLEEGSGPASSTALKPDDNCFGATIFKGNKRREGANQVLQDMTEILSSWPNGTTAVDLYYYARFRSRIPLNWWKEDMSQATVLEKALKADPVPDICTLAWLCNGPVGRSEVKTLPADYATWRAILDPDFLNESERLDRFLLLLQFGGCVEQRISGVPSGDAEMHESRSIFAWYIHSCRQSTVPIIIGTICRRFDQVKNMEHISSGTRFYMAGIDGNSTLSEGSGAEKDLLAYAGSEAISELWRHVLNSGKYRRPRNNAGRPLSPSNALGDIAEEAEENNVITPLLPRYPLPLGWEAHREAKAKKVKVEKDKTGYFKETFTRSVTLTKPTVSLVKMRQVKIGFLGGTEADVCHLDLISYIYQDKGQKGEVFDQDIDARFPYYDDDWFAMEWNNETPQKDVLSNLSTPWQITSFTTRVDQLMEDNPLSNIDLSTLKELIRTLYRKNFYGKGSVTHQELWIGAKLARSEVIL